MNLDAAELRLDAQRRLNVAEPDGRALADDPFAAGLRLRNLVVEDSGIDLGRIDVRRSRRRPRGYLLNRLGVEAGGQRSEAGGVHPHVDADRGVRLIELVRRSEQRGLKHTRFFWRVVVRGKHRRERIGQRVSDRDAHLVRRRWSARFFAKQSARRDRNPESGPADPDDAPVQQRVLRPPRVDDPMIAAERQSFAIDRRRLRNAFDVDRALHIECARLRVARKRPRRRERDRFLGL